MTILFLNNKRDGIHCSVKYNTQNLTGYNPVHLHYT